MPFQNPFKGAFQKARIRTTRLLTPTLDLTNSAFTSQRTITANTTGFIMTAESTAPSTDEGAAITLVSNSTGVAVMVNSTGTTWKYLNVTSVQPT